MRGAPAGLLAVVILAACAAERPVPAEGPVSADRPPPFPLASADPHPEPDLVGVTHVVQKGETLYRIARAYGLDPQDLMEVNGIVDPRALQPGMELFVPGALRPQDVPQVPPGAQFKPAEPAEPAPSAPAEPAPAPAPAPRQATLAWPVKGVLYSRFGMRQGQRHDGIDIAAPEGTAVTAAAAGTVIYAGEQPGYGSLVILRHGSGLVTVYAHASKLLVKEGQSVAAGAPVARVGQSGRTTGPHLHFEVREGTRPRNPLLYLR